MKDNDPRANERERRELAQDHQGDVIHGSGRAIDTRRLDQMVSVRLSPQVLAELRSIADARNTTLSAVVREAAAQYAAEADLVTELRWRVDYKGSRRSQAGQLRWKSGTASEGTVREASA